MSILTLRDVRLSFPDLWVPGTFEGKPTNKYGASFYIPKGSALDKQIRAAISDLAKATWADKAKKVLDEIMPVPQRFCFQDGDKKDYEGAKGHMILTAKSKTRPLVLDRNKTPLSEADGRPYAGCYVVGSVELWAQTKPASQIGIRCQLRGVQFYRDGDAFSGGSPANADEFEDLGDGADAPDLATGTDSLV